jgi:hypothetical protein
MSAMRWVAAALLAVGCGEGGGGKPDAPADSGFVIDVAPPPGVYDSLARCAPDGKWAVCSVMYRLTRAGFGMTRDTAVAREDGLMQAGMRLHFGGGAVSVFLYADSVNRRRDAAHLDRKLFLSPVQEPNGVARTIVESANMLVIMDVHHGRLRQRLLDAFLAGPPMQPKP